MNRKRVFARLAAFLLIAVFMLVTHAVLPQESADELFQAALLKKEAEGDLNAAVQLFQKIVATFAQNRAIAAKAELQIGLCYEKLGLKQAQDAFQRVVEKYPEQTDAVAAAKERLFVLGRAQTLIEKGDGKFRIRKVPELIGGSISRDGRWLTCMSDDTGDLLLMEVATGARHQLTQSASWDKGDYAAKFGTTISPDSKWVAYVWGRNWVTYDLKVINLDGTGERTLVRGDDASPYADAEIFPFDWTPDGQSILGLTTKKGESSRIVRVSVADGEIRLVKDFGARRPERLKLSPDGRWIAYDAKLNPDADNENDLFLLSVDGSREIALVQHPADDSLLDWAPGGDQILFASNRSGRWNAFIVPVEDGRARGEPALIKRDFGNVSSTSGAVPMDFTQDGSFYYCVTSLLGDVYVAILDPENGTVLSPPQKVLQPFEGSNEYPAWSPDGKYLGYISKSAVLGLMTVDTDEYREVVPKLGRMIRMSWFPDGESVLVVSGGIRRIDIKTADVRTLVTDGSGFHSPRCTPDGKKVLYEDDSWQDRIFRIMSYDIESGQKKEIYRSSQQIIRMDISPDGKWLAFLEAADSSLKVMPLEGGMPQVLYKFEKGWSTSVAWSPDAKYIYFTIGIGWNQELWRIPAAGGAAVRFDLAVAGMNNLDIHSDGRRIVFNTFEPNEEVWVMENFLPKR